MSYKIYNGLKFKTASMEDARALIENWTPGLAILHRDWLARLLAEMAVNLIDEAATSPGKHEGKVPLEEVRRTILERVAEMDRSGCRDPEIDPDFELSVFVHDTGIYGIAHTEREAWFENLLSQDFVEEFAYWNGTDGRPECVDEESWDRRGQLWSEMLSSKKPEAFKCIDRDLFVTAEETFAARPDFTTRTKRAARQLAEISEFRRRESETRPEGDEEGKERFNRLIEIAAGMARWLKEEGQSAIAEATATACDLLAPDIDLSHLEAAIYSSPVETTRDPFVAANSISVIGS
jgi:hypothetical protein